MPGRRGTSRMSVLRRARALVAVAAMVLVIASCRGAFPADSQGTLERATGGELRVGVSENPPFTGVAPDGAGSGSEDEVVTELAETIVAEVTEVPSRENEHASEMQDWYLGVWNE